MTIPIDKLKRIAAEIAAEKPELHFFGLVHRVDAPDRWDMLVSSDQLAPWSMEALSYVAERLKKVLTAQELVQIAAIVTLPRNNKVIARLSRSNQIQPGELTFLQPVDRFDQAIVMVPMQGAPAMVKT